MVTTYPSLTPTSIEWSLQSNTQNFISPLDKTTQTLELVGARWMATLLYQNLTAANARTLMAFLTSLNGASGRFYLHDHSLTSPRGVGTGTPLVDGASQTGSSLDTDGWTADQAGIMLAGDWFEVNGELKMITEDIDSTGDAATLVFTPQLRASPANNDPIDVSSPSGSFRLIDDQQARWAISPGEVHNFSFTCIEAFT